MGKKTITSSLIERAVDSATESGPLHPPETTTESWGSESTRSMIGWDDLNFLDPIIPTFMEDNINKVLGNKSRLFHHKSAFIGCFSCNTKDNIDYELFKKWKKNPTVEMTKTISDKLIKYIDNYYDFITTAPPSTSRDIKNYCCFKLCEMLSIETGIPFIISFKQRIGKKRHGVHAMIESNPPILVDNWNFTKQSILFIDDFITSGITAKQCFQVMRNKNNHVDGLIYCKY